MLNRKKAMFLETMKNRDKKMKKFYPKIITIILIVAISFMVIACNGKNPTRFVGAWGYSDDILILNRDGTGSFLTVDNMDTAFRWRVENKQFCVANEYEIIMEYEYTLTESELTIYNSELDITKTLTFKKLNDEQLIEAKNRRQQEAKTRNDPVRNNFVSDMSQFGIKAQAWYRSSTAMGGPDATGLTATTLPSLIAFINSSWTGAGPFTDTTGTYTFTVNGPTEITIFGTSIQDNSIRMLAVVNLTGGTIDENYGISISELFEE